LEAAQWSVEGRVNDLYVTLKCAERPCQRAFKKTFIAAGSTEQLMTAG